MMVKAFFSNLGYRKYTENDLSDVTAAMCWTSDRFYRYFVSFFFGDIQGKQLSPIKREEIGGSGRVDFWFEIDGVAHIIECKIWDKNQHFGDYEFFFNVSREQFGWIGNYSPEKEWLNKGYKAHTWEEFYDDLLINIPEDEEDKSLWEGYAEYLKRVCNIIKINKKMNTKGIYSLYVFNTILQKEVLNHTHKNHQFEVKTYDVGGSNQGGNGIVGPKTGAMGTYFKVNYSDNSIATSYGWMGIYFEREDPLICIGFSTQEGWGKPICDIITKSKIKELDTEGIYYESNHLWFEFSEHDKLNEAPDLETQKEILTQFVDKVLALPLEVLK